MFIFKTYVFKSFATTLSRLGREKYKTMHVTIPGDKEKIGKYVENRYQIKVATREGATVLLYPSSLHHPPTETERRHLALICLCFIYR